MFLFKQTVSKLPLRSLYDTAKGDTVGYALLQNSPPDCFSHIKDLEHRSRKLPLRSLYDTAKGGTVDYALLQNSPLDCFSQIRDLEHRSRKLP